MAPDRVWGDLMTRRHLVAVALLGAFLGWWLSPGRGYDVTPAPAPAPAVEWQEPYGGCDEAAAYPGTRGYRECKAHGLVP